MGESTVLLATAEALACGSWAERVGGFGGMLWIRMD